MGPNRIPRRDWLFGTSASLLALGATSRATAGLGQPTAPAPNLQAASDAEDADRVRRMKWWHEARFGMFIHSTVPRQGKRARATPHVRETAANDALYISADYN